MLFYLFMNCLYFLYDLFEKYYKLYDDIYKYKYIDFKFVVIYVINNSFKFCF